MLSQNQEADDAHSFPIEITSFLRSEPAWKLEDGKLVRDYTFPNFPSAISFVNCVAELAESASHHPNIDIRYNQVRISLVSYDVGGITERDTRMAQRISRSA